MSDRDWLDDAACRGIDPELWFPISSDPLAAEPAQRICHDCPVQPQCLDAAIAVPATKDRDGIFGGLTAPQRAIIRRRRAKPARPATLTAAPVEPDAPEVRVPVAGVRWLMQALHSAGWTAPEIADVVGSTAHIVNHVANGRVKTLPEAVVARVRDRYASMVASPPVTHGSGAARLTAARRGWPFPADLDMDRVDDPHYEPIRQET